MTLLLSVLFLFFPPYVLSPLALPLCLVRISCLVSARILLVSPERAF